MHYFESRLNVGPYGFWDSKGTPDIGMKCCYPGSLKVRLSKEQGNRL